METFIFYHPSPKQISLRWGKYDAHHHNHHDHRDKSSESKVGRESESTLAIITIMCLQTKSGQTQMAGWWAFWWSYFIQWTFGRRLLHKKKNCYEESPRKNSLLIINLLSSRQINLILNFLLASHLLRTAYPLDGTNQPNVCNQDLTFAEFASFLLHSRSGCNFWG